jgi:hypothetical protein
MSKKNIKVKIRKAINDRKVREIMEAFKPFEQEKMFLEQQEVFLMINLLLEDLMNPLLVGEEQQKRLILIARLVTRSVHHQPLLKSAYEKLFKDCPIANITIIRTL